jgi:hypothetical protein
MEQHLASNTQHASAFDSASQVCVCVCVCVCVPEGEIPQTHSMPVPLIVPLKSIQAGDFRMQLYVQSPAAPSGRS